MLGDGRSPGAVQFKPVYLVLWFDVEDYALPQTSDVVKRLATFLTQQGIRATFRVVGEKARMLEREGRRDVIEALDRPGRILRRWLCCRGRVTLMLGARNHLPLPAAIEFAKRSP